MYTNTKKRVFIIILFVISLVFVSFSTFSLIDNPQSMNSSTTLGGDTAKSINYWGGLLNQCPKDVQNPEVTQAVTDCMTKVWVKAWEKKMLDTFNQSLKIFIENNPNLNDFCHQSGHKAGYVSYREKLLDQKLLESVVIVENTCNNGFLHGLFDGFANKAKQPDEFSLLVDVCMSLSEHQHWVCVDGTGHAAFQYTHDLYKALDMCKGYSEVESLHGCGLGVFMQMFRPDVDNNFDRYYDYSSLESKWPSICSLLEDDDSYVIFSKGCMEVFGNLLVQDIGYKVLIWSDNFESGKSSAVENDEVAMMVKTNFSACDLLSNTSGAKSCKKSYAENLVWQTSSNYDALKILCKQIDSQFYGDCFNSNIPAFANLRDQVEDIS